MFDAAQLMISIAGDHVHRGSRAHSEQCREGFLRREKNPGGIAAISRWLSEATPPAGLRCTSFHPGRMTDFEGRGEANKPRNQCRFSVIPYGMMSRAIAFLNVAGALGHVSHLRCKDSLANAHVTLLAFSKRRFRFQ